MRVSVSEKEVKITDMSVVCEGDHGVNKCFFDLPKSFEKLSVTAVFGGVIIPLVNGECFIPSLKKGNTTLGVYAYKRNGDELELMYSPKGTCFYVEKGSFTDDVVQEEIPDISHFEEFCGMLAGYCAEQIKEHCNLKKVENPKINELECGVYNVSGTVSYSNGRKCGVDVESGVLFVFSPSENETKVGKNFLLFADNENIFKGSVGDESSEKIEKLPNFVGEITKDSSENEYPSAKAVYDFVLDEYIADSDRPPSSKAVETALLQRCDEMSSVTANSLKGGASGRIVSVKDVSPLSHTMSVGLNDTVGNVDLQTVEISVCGKNLFSDFIKSIAYSNGTNVTVNQDGSVTCDTVEGSPVSQIGWIRLPAGTYTISNGLSESTMPYLAAVFYGDKSDTSGTLVGEVNTRYSSYKTITTNKVCDVKLLLYTSSATEDNFTIYPQLECGNEATLYEQYKKPQKYFLTEKGTVDVSVEYPNTTVFSGTDGVDIEVEYNRDINKAFDELKNAIISLGGNV